MMEFQVATDQQLKKEEGSEDLFEFTLNGLVFKATRPTPGQTNVLFSAAGSHATEIIWKILDRILVKSPAETPVDKRLGSIRDLRNWMFEGIISPAMLFGGDELNGKGILDTIILEFAGRPTQPSEPLSGSPKSGGRRSTGRSPSKTSSSSGSTAT